MDAVKVEIGDKVAAFNKKQAEYTQIFDVTLKQQGKKYEKAWAIPKHFKNR